jgi:SAM-dependent methyltransferase
MAHSDLPPTAQMLQFVMGSWLSQCVGAAARLGIADQLANGPKTAEELARASGANGDAVFRVLRALASVGVFELAHERFSLTPLGETLRAGVPGSVRNFAIAETDPAHWATWGRFTSAVRQGRKMSRDALGMEIWEYYAQHPEDGDQFSRAMSDLSGMTSSALLATYDFAGASRIVDVGGAHGALLAAILRAQPRATGVLFDLPNVAQSARTHWEGSELAGRVEIVGGDFFKALPAGGDVYLLKHILHDWDDAHALSILKNVRAAAKPGSKLLVVEFALPKSAEPSPAHFIDLNMLVVLDGRERTEEQYAALLEQAGFRLARFLPTPGPVAISEAVLA